MRTRHMGLVAVALLVTAGSVLAQNDAPGGGEGRGRGGFGGGRGGFGRMGGDRNSYLGLLRIDEVKAELKVTDDQSTKIREVGEEVRNAARPEGIDFEGLRDASPEEQQAAFAKLQEAGAKREQEARTKLASVLDEVQMKRLRGLWVQRSGALAALNDTGIATDLKLTDEQKTMLATQRKAQRAAMGGGFGRGRGEGGTPPPAGGEAGGNFFERMQEQRKAADEQALGVLNDEQKTALAAIEGDKFTFPAPQFGGPGGGGRGRDRGEGGDRPNGGPEREAQ